MATDSAKVGPPEIKYTKLFINGEFVDGVAGKTFATINPATGEVICHVSEALAEDVDIAVKAADAAFKRDSAWRTMDPSARGLLLHRLADLMERDGDLLARLDALDNGKPYAVARAADVPLAVKCFRYYSGFADKVCGTTVPIDGKYFAYTRRVPVGVVGQIIPWNFPLLMLAWKVAPALTTGNCVVLKSAEQTPLSALHFASLVKEAGFPPGVFNLLNGYGPSCGAAIVAHPLVSKVAFTGSTEVGRIIQREAAGTLKNVTLELGGKSPLIVMPDADLDMAVELAHFALFFNQGQVCTAASRTFVHADIYDAFVAKSVARARARTVGDAWSGAEQGPQVDEDQYKKILGLIETGVREGAKLECGGRAHGSKGYFIEPTVFSHVEGSMTIAREEIFGPVQSILKFTSVDEVIDRANDTMYGLAAAVVSKDLDTALKIAHNLRAGTTWVNCGQVFSANMPFGGFKASGIGRELGPEGLNQYSETQSVIIATP